MNGEEPGDDLQVNDVERVATTRPPTIHDTPSRGRSAGGATVSDRHVQHAEPASTIDGPNHTSLDDASLDHTALDHTDRDDTALDDAVCDRPDRDDTAMGHPGPGSPLGEPDFRRLWITNVAFFIVANAQRFAFGWVVLDLLLRDESAQGLAVFALGLPVIFLVLHAGAWADRWDRKRILIVTQSAGAVVMGLTAICITTGVIGPGDGGQADTGYGWLLVLTLLAGAASTIGHPVRSALVPVLVRREQLFSAIAVNAIAMTLSLILGPVLVQVAGERFGFDGGFWFMAILLAIGTAVLLRLRVPPHDPDAARDRRSILAETGDAVRHIWNDRHLRTLFGLLLLSSMTVNPAVMVTVQAHVKEEFARSAGDAAIPFAFMGLGIAISSLFLMRKGELTNKGAVFQRAMLCGSTITFLVGVAPNFAGVVVLSLLMGLAGGFFINMNQGLIQSSTPPELMGRTMGVYTLVSQGLFPLGALLLGVGATAIGTGRAISAAAAVSFTVVLTTYVRNAELRRL